MNKVTLVASAIAVLACTVQGAAIPPELEFAAKVVRSTCVQETGVVEDLIVQTGTGVFSEDENLKCYYKCLLEKFALVQNDDINYEAMMVLVPVSMKEMANRVLDKCRGAAGKDLCEKAYNFNKCAYHVNPQEYMVI